MEEYDISANGFLPNYCCQTSLLIPDEIVKIFINNHGDNYYINMNNFPWNIDILYKTDFKKLPIEEIRYIYSIISMIIHKYIVCTEIHNTTINEYLSTLWLKTSKILGLNPVLSYASVVLYNWSLIDKNSPFSLSNIKANYLMTGNETEEWFYLVMTGFEGISGNIIPRLYKCLESSDEDFIYSTLIELNTVIKTCHDYLKNISPENFHPINNFKRSCDPDFFFNKLRKFLWGSNKFDNGINLMYKNKIINIKYDGGSGGQSTLLQIFDRFLNIKHDSNSTSGYIKSTWDYMPKKHREFLFLFNKSIVDNKKIILNDKFTSLYNMCIDEFTKLRITHWSVIGIFIMPFLNDGRGTGGTDLKEFLSNMKKETQKSHLV